MALEGGWNKDPLKDLYPTQAHTNHPTKWLEMLVNVLRMIRDVNGVPLVAVICKRLVPPPDNEDMVFGLRHSKYISHNDENENDSDNDNREDDLFSDDSNADPDKGGYRDPDENDPGDNSDPDDDYTQSNDDDQTKKTNSSKSKTPPQEPSGFPVMLTGHARKNLKRERLPMFW